MATIHPRKLRGSWTDGYVLDVHSKGSTFLGYDEFGHPVFDTLRTEVGELLYRLKYRSDVSALAEIGETAERFLRAWQIGFDLVVAVPPTRARQTQPVYQLIDEISRRFSVPATQTAVRKLPGHSAELKNLHEFEERRVALEKAFVTDPEAVAGRQILLVDDLVRSGATLNAVAESLLAAGASRVYAFALTQTRRV